MLVRFRRKGSMLDMDDDLGQLWLSRTIGAFGKIARQVHFVFFRGLLRKTLLFANGTKRLQLGRLSV